MILRKWDNLPDSIRTEEVRPYYDILKRHTFGLILKRCFDVIMSLLLLIILSPVFLVLAVWIKIDSQGPVFFRQVRITQYGREFRIFKFRTMVNDAEKKGSLVTTLQDVRITNVGKKIRHVRLDEIPQLINVLIGDMTFVGTRPEVPKYVASYSNEMWATLLLPAGVTSEASIEYKDEDDLISDAKNPDETYIKVVLPQKMNYNLDAIRFFSLKSEIKTLGRTLKAVS
jgi:Sugar transferases involved in lipopolysaccharide synthesis